MTYNGDTVVNEKFDNTELYEVNWVNPESIIYYYLDQTYEEFKIAKNVSLFKKEEKKADNLKTLSNLFLDMKGGPSTGNKNIVGMKKKK